MGPEAQSPGTGATEIWPILKKEETSEGVTLNQTDCGVNSKFINKPITCLIVSRAVGSGSSCLEQAPVAWVPPRSIYSVVGVKLTLHWALWIGLIHAHTAVIGQIDH